MLLNDEERPLTVDWSPETAVLMPLTVVVSEASDVPSPLIEVWTFPTAVVRVPIDEDRPFTVVERVPSEVWMLPTCVERPAISDWRVERVD